MKSAVATTQGRNRFIVHSSIKASCLIGHFRAWREGYPARLDRLLQRLPTVPVVLPNLLCQQPGGGGDRGAMRIEISFHLGPGERHRRTRAGRR